LSIEDRVNEITFNSAMLKEMRAIAFVQKLLQQNMLKDEYRQKYRNVLIHAIRAEDVMRSFGMTTKFDTSWSVLNKLFEAGRKSTKDWITENFDKIGKVSSVDLEADYLKCCSRQKVEDCHEQRTFV
jgi:NTE family protein